MLTEGSVMASLLLFLADISFHLRFQRLECDEYNSFTELYQRYAKLERDKEKLLGTKAVISKKILRLKE